MIDFLILYVLFEKELTIYKILKNIKELFGSFVSTGMGSIHPALKKLLKEKYIDVTEIFSEGGKKSSFYKITPLGKTFLKNYFLKKFEANPKNIYSSVLIVISCLDVFDEKEKGLILENVLQFLELHEFDIKNKLEDKYLKLSSYQKETLTYTKEEVLKLKDFVGKFLKEDSV